MKKYIFSDRVGKKVTKYEIVAETLEEAQALLSAKLEAIRGISVIGVGLPDYIEPIDPPIDLTLKTFNITYRDSRGLDETITYKALSLDSATGRFLEDFPEQAGKAREIHMPLENYAIDRENAKKKDYLGNIFHDPEGSSESEKLQEELEPIDMTTTTTTKETRTTDEPPVKNNGMFATATAVAKLFTALFVSLIGLGLVSSVLFGVDGGFGIVTNIKNLLGEADGLTGLIVIFLVYFLFIRSDEGEKT